MPARRVPRLLKPDHSEDGDLSPHHDVKPPPLPDRKEERPDGPRKKKKGGTGWFFAIAVGMALTMVLLAAFGIWQHIGKGHERDETAKAVQAGAQTVQVVKPSKSPATFDFNLPGSAEALTTATLYARINGYLKSRLVDIGDRVQEGQLLAEIDAPEINAQLNQARAQLEQNRAAEGIARVTYERQKKLLDEKVVSRQEHDQAEAALNQAVANVKAAQANVENLSVQQGFTKIVAPFSGVVTTRYINDGALISSGSGTSAQSLFTIAQTDTLRVYIYVPQAYAPSVKPGQEVEITLAEYARQVFKGKVTRTADALDLASRTERVEIQLPSENGKLLPGMYMTVRFTVAQPSVALLVPANTIDIRREGPRVAVVGDDKKVAYRAVNLGRDFGKTVEILSGVDANENLVVNPSPELVEGAQVDIAQDDKKAKPGSATGASQ